MSAPAPAPASTAAVVQHLLERIGAGDWDGVAALFAAEFDWHLSWPASELDGPVPWVRPRHTAADVGAHFATLAAHHAPDGAGTTVDRVLVDGADAVVLGTIRNVLRRPDAAGAARVGGTPPGGTPYRADFALHLRVEGGRVRRYHVYEDSLAVSNAWHATHTAPP